MLEVLREAFFSASGAADNQQVMLLQRQCLVRDDVEASFLPDATTVKLLPFVRLDGSFSMMRLTDFVERLWTSPRARLVFSCTGH